MSTTYFNLSDGSLTQDWSNTGLISVNDDWSGVPSIVGYLGDIDPGSPTAADPRSLTGSANGVVDVIANQTNTTINNGGVAEFQIADPTLALQGSGTADAPSLVFYLNAAGRQNVRFQANLRDIDATVTAGVQENAAQQINVQYRTSDTGNWINVPGGYFADVTNLGATTVTAVDLILPEAANNAATLQVRVLTTNAVGSDEWVGIDDILVSSSPLVAANPGALSIADASVSEGNGGTAAVDFVVSREGGSSGAVSATYTVTLPGAAGGASADDLATTTLTGTVNFADGQTSQTITLQVAGDTAIEPDETFTVTLSAPTGGATIDGATAIGTIVNDDAAAPAATPFINEFHYDDASADTGEFVEIAGPAGLNLAGYSIVLYNGANGQSYNTVQLSGVIPNQQNGFGTIAFTYPDTASGTIQNGAPDGIALVGPNGVVEFISYEGVFTATNGPAAGQQSVDVGVFETGTVEGTSISRTGQVDDAGDFRWEVTGATAGAVNTGETFGTPQPTVSVGDASVVEGDDGTAQLVFTLTRSGPLDAFTVDYATANGTATAGEDYDAASGTVSFAEGQATATVAVTVRGDVAVEPDETLRLSLSNAAGANIGDGQATGTIVSDDLPPTVSIGDASAFEGDSGISELTFTVTRTGGDEPFSVEYITTGGSATVGQDYQLATGTLTFAAGETSKQITVLVNADTIREANETLNVQLVNPTDGAQIADASGTGTILNDEFTLIHNIQGSAYYSPILAADGITAFNQASTTQVTIRAVITAVDGEGARQGFYITEEKSDWDNSLSTSEGIFVMTRNDSGIGTTLADLFPGLKAGDLVTVSANVMEYQQFQNMPRTMLVNPTALVVTGESQPLPTLVLDSSVDIPSAILTDVAPNYFDTNDDAGDTFDASLYALSFFEGVEGMLVTVPDMVVADGFVSVSGGQPLFKAYSTVHADADQINSRGGYTVAGDPPLSPPDTPNTDDDTQAGGRFLHDGDVNPDILELDFTDFAIDAPQVSLGNGTTSPLTQTATIGDTLGDVTGIIDFDFTDLKLFVTDIDPSSITNSQPVREVTALGNDARALTIATFNVENLDPGDVTTQQTAAKEGKFYDLARAIVNNLNAPDILSIEEIQDNNGAAAGGVTVGGVSLSNTDASITWEMLVSALNDISGERYQWVDQEPVYNAEGGEQSGNIRVGFLYNTSRVQLGDLAADATLAERRQFTDRIGDGIRDAGDRIAVSDAEVAIDTAAWSGTRKSLLGEFTFNGNTVYAMANHLPSKGGSGEFWQFNQNVEAGQPANSPFNNRSRIGEDLYDVLNRIQTTQAGAGIVSGGDYNEYYFYRALEAATGYTYADGTARNDGARFDNLTITELTEAERYTYTFDGRSQAIDHILANGLLSDVASYDVVHINTGYNVRGTGENSSLRLSDHDPALASFDFRSLAEVLTGTAASETIEGMGGDDVLIGGEGDDVLDGGAGFDTVSYVDAIGGVTVRLDLKPRETGQGRDTFVSIEGVIGSTFADTIYGDAGGNRLFGGAGDDRISGGAGNDVIEGGAGLDALTGGTGADTFVFRSLADFTRDGTTYYGDKIGDFSRAEGDRIDLSGIGDLTFIGTGAFTATGVGEVRYTRGNSSPIQIDADGDGIADAVLLVTGRVAFVASDFIL